MLPPSVIGEIVKDLAVLATSAVGSHSQLMSDRRGDGGGGGGWMVPALNITLRVLSCSMAETWELTKSPTLVVPCPWWDRIF